MPDLGPLHGVRILDFTRYQQGPYATVMLSDLGADVLKVEEPGDGDPGRALGLQPDGWCTYFQALNRNKRSITIDIRKPEGAALVKRLVPEYDVVTENFRPGMMERCGLGHDDLAAVNPRVITASATGFGGVGPDARRPSFDIIGQAMSGIMYNHSAASADGMPIQLTGGLADQVGAIILALGVCSAIIAREHQGIGQHVDTSLLGSQIALQSLQIQGFLRTGNQTPPVQRVNPTFAHFKASDGNWLVVGILDPKWWPRLCNVLDRPDMITDERFEAPQGRYRHREELLDELDKTFATRPRAEWLKRLVEADIPNGPVNDYASMAREPQVIANRYVDELDHPTFGTIDVVGSPIQMSKNYAGPRTGAPELGQNTEEVLLGLGCSWDEIERLRNLRAI
jgi:crotonobetainyl-CoA:carnitine CoA-transferase CaiB-like acyl-CoA transferase